MNYIKDLEEKRDLIRDHLIRMRIEEKLSTKQLSKAIGISMPTLNSFMRGERNPYFLSLCKIKEFLESKGIMI